MNVLRFDPRHLVWTADDQAPDLGAASPPNPFELSSDMFLFRSDPHLAADSAGSDVAACAEWAGVRFDGAGLFYSDWSTTSASDAVLPDAVPIADAILVPDAGTDASPTQYDFILRTEDPAAFFAALHAGDPASVLAGDTLAFDPGVLATIASFPALSAIPLWSPGEGGDAVDYSQLYRYQTPLDLLFDGLDTPDGTSTPYATGTPDGTSSEEPTGTPTGTVEPDTTDYSQLYRHHPLPDEFWFL
jgi:hypothetical protein